MFLIEILKAIAQGIVEGITEWLPVSSTGHIILLNKFWPMKTETGDAFFDVFEVVIQLGAILAVVLLYWGKLNPFSLKKSPTEKKGTWVLWSKVLIASVPAAVIGIAMELFWDGIPDNPVVIAAALIVYGVAFIIMESRKSHTTKVETVEDISYKHAFGIGAFQMLALIPGTSRSGSTILGASLLGTSRTAAAEFSFFMAIPVMLGASGLKLVKALLLDGISFSGEEWILLGVATVVSFVVSLLVIRGLMAFIKKHSFKPFGWYRIVLGAVVLGCVAMGWL